MYVLGFGFISGLVYVNTLVVASASHLPSRVTPLVVAAFVLGGVLMGPLIRQLGTHDLGLFAVFPVAVSLAVAGLAGIAVDKRIRESADQGKKPPRAGPVNRLTLVMLVTCFGTCSGAGLLVLGLSSSIVERSGGSIALSTAAIGCVALANMTGRLSVSMISEVLHSVWTVRLGALVTAVGAGLLTLAVMPPYLVAGLVLIGLGYGLIASAIPVFCTEQFGPDGFTGIFPQVFLAWGLAGLTMPWLAGWLYDQTGDFRATFLLSVVLTVLALVSSMLIRPEQRN